MKSSSVSSLPADRRTTQLNSLDRRPAKASITINSPMDSASDLVKADAVSLVFESIAAIGMSEKEAAHTMALDPATLSRIKTGQGRLSIESLWRMPDRFWFEFWQRIGRARGMSTEQERQENAALIGELVRKLVERIA